MRQRDGLLIIGQQINVRSIDAQKAPDRRQRIANAGIEILGRQVDEVRGNAGDQLLEVDAVTQRLLNFPALASVHRRGDQFGDGDGEVLLLHQPVALRPHLLVADDAGDLTEVPDGRFDHGADSERTQIGVCETGGARIVLRIVGGDAPLALQRAEICRIADRCHFHSG